MSHHPVILVTGAAGFIGYQLVRALDKRGYSLVSVDKLEHFRERPEHNDTNFQTRVDRDELFEWLKNEQPKLDGIFHIGACTDTTVLDEAYLEKMNVEYSKAVWRYATQNQIPLIYASSAATYGAGSLGYSDSEERIPRLEPLNPYGRSKQAFDQWALAQEKEGFHPPVWSGFKFFNVYGFGEGHKGHMASVVYKAYHQIKERGQLKLFKSYREGIPHGEQKRDFIYVHDVVDVLLSALKQPIPRGIYNLGTGEARSFTDLAKATFRGLNQKENIEWIEMPEELKDRYQYFTQANMENLRKTGYQNPFTSLEDGINDYIQKLEAYYS